MDERTDIPLSKELTREPILSPLSYENDQGLIHTVSIILNIVNGSVWGVLSRKGLTQLTTYSGRYLGGIVWANFVACLVMGVLVTSNSLWSIVLGRGGAKSSIAVYVGLSTGFCGTLLSFSSLIIQAFEQASAPWGDKDVRYLNHGYGVMEFLSVIIAQLCISNGGYMIGIHLAKARSGKGPAFLYRIYCLVNYLFLITGVLAMLGACILTGIKSLGPWRSWTFSIIFAPFGAISRYYLACTLNLRYRLPYGTFAANVMGTLVLAVIMILNQGLVPGRTTRVVKCVLQCQVLSGLSDGFCGGLTTVSTYIVELNSQPTLRYSYIYGTLLIVTSFILVITTLGSYSWCIGVVTPLCS